MEEIKSGHPWARIVIYILTLLVVIGVIFFLLNWQSVFKAITPPIPVIVSSKVDDTSLRLGDYSARTRAQIRNDGGNGDVVFEATVHQGEKHWTKTTKRYFQSKQTAEMELIFDEVGFWGSTPLCSMRAYAFGK